MAKPRLLDHVKSTPFLRRGPKSWFDGLDPGVQEQVLELRRAHLRGELPHTKRQLFGIARDWIGLTIKIYAWVYWWDGDGKKAAEEAEARGRG